MEIKHFTIDCRQFTDSRQAHGYLKNVFSFPGYYGNNLDALYDCLTELPPCTVRMERPWELARLGDWAVSMLRVFCDARDANPNLHLI